MSSNTRIHALFVIGSDTLPESNLFQVIDNINKRYGGCTVTTGKGYWSEDGAEFQTTYDRVKQENCYQIEVCSTIEDFDLHFLQDCFIPVADYAQWIHYEEWKTTMNHFDIQAIARQKIRETQPSCELLDSLYRDSELVNA